VCLAVLSVSNALAQATRALTPANSAPSVDIAPFIDPTFAPLSPPPSPQANTLEISYVDPSSEQLRYYGLPSFVNFDTSNDPGPQIFRDTMVTLAQRFSAPTSFGTGGKVYLDSIFMVVFPLRFTDNTENKINITLNRQTSSNNNFYPGALVPGSDTLSIFPDELLLEEENQLMLRFPNHPNVGRNFFVQVQVPYDPTYDDTENNFVAILGDSNFFDGTIVPNTMRMVIGGFWFRTPYAGFTINDGEPYYGNLFMVAFVSDDTLKAGVNDINLQGDALAQNYPNPFNPSTNIAYSLATGGNASLKVYNALGNVVATLLDGYQSAGKHEAMFDASELPSGTYYYTLKSGAFTSTKRMVLSK
jgi:hypothetical protein